MDLSAFETEGVGFRNMILRKQSKMKMLSKRIIMFKSMTLIF